MVTLRPGQVVRRACGGSFSSYIPRFFYQTQILQWPPAVLLRPRVMLSSAGVQRRPAAPTVMKAHICGEMGADEPGETLSSECTTAGWMGTCRPAVGALGKVALDQKRPPSPVACPALRDRPFMPA